MGIQEGSIIKKDDIFEYHITKDYTPIASVAVSGGFLSTNYKELEGYFWIRNDHTLYESTVWDTVTTYALKDRVEYDSKVWESLQGSNLNHVPDVSPTYWREVENGIPLTTFNNINYPTLESLSIFEGVIGARFETYYPYNIHPPTPTIQKLYLENDLSCINNNVICVHWYNGHVLSKQYVNGDGFNRDCSMTTILKNEGCI